MCPKIRDRGYPIPLFVYMYLAYISISWYYPMFGPSHGGNDSINPGLWVFHDVLPRDRHLTYRHLMLIRMLRAGMFGRFWWEVCMVWHDMAWHGILYCSVCSVCSVCIVCIRICMYTPYMCMYCMHV